MTARRNPFEQWPDEAMGRVFALPTELRAAIDRGARLIEIVGDAGCGKSTHLAAIGRLAAAQGVPWAYQHLLRGPAGTPPTGGWWLLDEAQALRTNDLLALASAALERGTRLALASHRPLSRRLERLAPVSRLRLRRLRGASAAEALLARWLAAAGHDASEWFEPEALQALARLSRGVPRKLVRLGYELAEDRQPGRRITAGEVALAYARLRRDAPGLFAIPPRSAPCQSDDGPSCSA